MPIYELSNPSDAYTFEAPDIKIAGVCACLLSPSYGARDVESGEHTPIMFGWNEWLAEQGIDAAFVESHKKEIADAWDSFLIGSDRAAALTEAGGDTTKRNKRQSRKRTSMSQIGERAYALAEAYRASIVSEAS